MEVYLPNESESSYEFTVVDTCPIISNRYILEVTTADIGKTYTLLCRDDGDLPESFTYTLNIIEFDDCTHVRGLNPDTNACSLCGMTPEHGDWIYEADGATLTAKCSTHEGCSESVCLNLLADSKTYTGSAVSASYGTNEIKSWERNTWTKAPDITYEKQSGSNWISIDSAPVSAGNYRAVAEFSDNGSNYTIYKEFTIGAVGISSVLFKNPVVVACGTPATVKDLSVGSDEYYTASAIKWSPDDAKFRYNQKYTATLTLTAKDNHAFINDVTIPTGWKKSSKSTSTKLVLTKEYAATAKAKVTNLKVTSKGRRIIVSWKKTNGVSGYQVVYKLKSDKKYKTLKNTSAAKVTSKKLKKGKKYNVKVRAYTNLKGKKVYGEWTKVKTIKCK